MLARAKLINTPIIMRKLSIWMVGPLVSRTHMITDVDVPYLFASETKETNRDP